MKNLTLQRDCHWVSTTTFSRIKHNFSFLLTLELFFFTLFLNKLMVKWIIWLTVKVFVDGSHNSPNNGSIEIWCNRWDFFSNTAAKMHISVLFALCFLHAGWSSRFVQRPDPLSFIQPRSRWPLGRDPSNVIQMSCNTGLAIPVRGARRALSVSSLWQDRDRRRTNNAVFMDKVRQKKTARQWCNALYKFYL